jgi:hypothetical protein
MFGFLWRLEGARGAQSYNASGAYAEAQSHHALRECEDKSLRDWFSKKIRVTANDRKTFAFRPAIASCLELELRVVKAGLADLVSFRFWFR